MRKFLPYLPSASVSRSNLLTEKLLIFTQLSTSLEKFRILVGTSTEEKERLDVKSCHQKHWCDLLFLLFSLFFLWSVLILLDQNAGKGSRASFPVCPCHPALALCTFVCLKTLTGQLYWCLPSDFLPWICHWVPPRAQRLCRRAKARGFLAPCSQ